MIKFLCWLKVNSIALKLYISSIDWHGNIHEKFNAIFREREKYERMKENVRNVSECSSAKKRENIRLNKVNLRKVTSL